MQASYRLTLEYDGAGFAGWQLQPGGVRTVQGTLEEALTQVVGGHPRVRAAGRTDAGVHAEGQVVGVALETRLAPEALRSALNAVLPLDLAVVDLATAPADFHPRRDARSKLYRYQIWNGPDRSPLRRRSFYHVRGPLDLEAMTRAARNLEGSHDFASFQAAGSGVRSTLRILERLEILGSSGAEVRLEAEALGFLRHMVRNLAGTLVEVGRGRRDPDSMARLLARRDRSAAGPTAPPEGLTLIRVNY